MRGELFGSREVKQGAYNGSVAQIFQRHGDGGGAGHSRPVSFRMGERHGSILGRGIQGGPGVRHPILIEIHADWCPTCKAQKPILDQLTAAPKFKDLKIFRVDFDAMKPVVKQFGAQMQSTLIVFKGAAEQGRSVGDTKQASIAALLDKSL